jgi:serine/threonine protein kinase
VTSPESSSAPPSSAPASSAPASRSIVPIAEGETIAGKYKVERILGRGGMGVVVAAMHVHLRQRVDIKFLLPDAPKEFHARFMREARASAKLKSEHVARVLDVAELPDGAPYLVMEYLDGSDLSAVLKKRGPLPVEDAVEYLLQAGEAIAEAHALGIVHRDLKPSNLFVIARPDRSLAVKVLDFGLS